MVTSMCLPQGSILSVTLFSLKTNTITLCLKFGVDCSLHGNYFQICYRSANMSINERQLQLCLNKRQHWATDNGCRLSKAVYAHLPEMWSPFRQKLNSVVEETKCVGVIFDRRLSFVPYLKTPQYFKSCWQY